ncbi:P-loop containing nucleoside triphosphate hydrolase protein [Fimicolochytrium jonesii]|uniref:P-loop containing nucleoside triphosphate hydrolase protein n=1 Tax=Fimicolochytrium jonesii TaxID=1396493 RepID=UPI0022FED02F|nr:P-loop containing nucleoside triphosphate hydrolase protein [Fimicolochytrium jonesii]KAI8820557.1 P-loop containing nucleoside triphosphate hydrolase protein [Fimicolochytrium jonesii]
MVLAPHGSDTFVWIDSAATLAVTLFLLQLVRSAARSLKSSFDIVVRLNCQSLLTGVIYEKALRLHCSETQEYSEGRVMNMISADVKDIFASASDLHLVWLTPAQLVATLILLNRLIGWSMWVGIGCMLVLMTILMAFAPVYERFCELFLEHEDTRLNKIREMLLGIRMVKLRAMESIFANEINSMRDKQIDALKSKVGVNTFAWTLTALITIIMPVTSFLAFASRSDGTFSASIIFPALALFSALAEPLNFYPGMLTDVWKLRVSWARVAGFLRAREVDPVVNGTFTWAAAAADSGEPSETDPLLSSEARPAPILKGVDVSIPSGALMMVVGAVGSGKSSFLSALLGHMVQISGETKMNGSTAYAPQQPWITTGTIKDNIVFNAAINDAKLKQVIEACCLESDLGQMRAGLETSIGELGVNLSGGQKARVALARAGYADADIILLDDPLGSLDPVVSRDVFAKCIQGVLAGKTRILVTHQLHLLQHADHIIVLKENSIAEQGTYTDLMAANGTLSALVKDHQVDDAAPASCAPEIFNAEDVPEASAEGDDDFQKTESRIRGRISKAHLMAYIRSIGGWKMVSVILMSVSVKQAASVMAAVWLAWWSEKHFADFTQGDYFEVYGGLAAGQAVSISLFLVVVYYAGFRGSKYFHPAALQNILRSPLSFFEREPIGRIMNRFSGDLDTIDDDLPSELHLFLTNLFDLLGTFAILTWVSYWIVVIAVPIVACYWHLQRRYRPVAREIRRMMAIQRSPLFAYISESLAGVNVIRAFCREKDFIATQRRHLDASLEVNVIRAACTVWLEFRSEFLASFVTLGMALVGVLSEAAAGFVALALVYTVALNTSVQAFVKSSVDLEAALAAVERLSEYATDLIPEPPANLPTDPTSTEWPTEGKIVVTDLKIAYPSNPDAPVLKGLTLIINPGEHIAVVGRTGSGKSTFMSALFRVVEYTSGSVTIDGRDASTLGLNVLRSSIQIIPQDPVLFEGTIRSNLLLGHANWTHHASITDADIWSAIRRVGLGKMVEDLPDKLDHAVESGGRSLSFGQRQLICLARALLERPKILVLDEATASLDAEADAMVQDVIAREMKGVTVISVAHRLHTIAGFDRVLVLDDGEIVESGTPTELLRNSETHFNRLASAMGMANREALVRAAQA